MKMRFFYLATLLLAFTVTANAQNGWKWPEDKATAEENYVRYSDAVKAGNFRDAVQPFLWLYAHCPDLNKSLYQNGAKIYEGLANAEQDAAKKAELVDSAMWTYDQRIKYFGEEANVINRKALKAYKYYIKNYDKSEWLLELFDQAYAADTKYVLYQSMLAYMNVIKVNKLKWKNLTDEQILDRYDRITEVYEAKVAEGKNVEKINTAKNHIDNILTEIVDIDCEFVINNMGPKFKENPDDIKLVKRMFSFMLSGKCTDDPLFLDVAKKLQEVEPTYGLAKVVGNKSLAEKDYASAEQYFNQALTLTEDGTQKAEVFIQLGKMKQIQRQKSAARNFLRQAAGADPSNKEAYEIIGDLYMTSFDDCKEEKDMVQDRLVFIAAYKMYSRAGNTKKMANAKEQFPSKEEIFTANYEKGQAMTINCWIGESVTLDSRD